MLNVDFIAMRVFRFHYEITPAKGSWLNMRPRPSGASWGQEGRTRVKRVVKAVFESTNWKHGKTRVGGAGLGEGAECGVCAGSLAV